MTLETQEITLQTGEKVRVEYYSEGDCLEIIFRTTEAMCAVELTESIVLRFDWETEVPLSLSIISYSKIQQSSEYGEIYFQLLADEWPEEAYAKIWKMLHNLPLNAFLKMSGYVPAHTHQTIPTTTLKQPENILQAA